VRGRTLLHDPLERAISIFCGRPGPGSGGYFKAVSVLARFTVATTPDNYITRILSGVAELTRPIRRYDGESSARI